MELARCARIDVYAPTTPAEENAMEQHEEELVKRLALQNVELRRAYERHANLADEVDELSSRPHLTAEEEVRRRDLQKQKLAEKDKIMRMLEDHRRAQPEASSGS